MSNFVSKVFSTKGVLKNHASLGEIPPSNVLLKRTFKVAWPAITESLLMALVAFVDTLMVSTLGDEAVAAVGITSQPRLLLLALFFSLQPAVSALVARRRGEGRQDNANQVLKMSLVICSILVVLVSVLSVTFADPFLRFSGTHESNHDYAVQYFRITVGGIFFAVMSMIINSAQRGAGNTKLSMRTNIVSNVVNVIGNYLLIGGHLGFPALGVKGAAIATVFGQFCGFIMAIISVFHRDGYLYLRRKTGAIFNKETFQALGRLWPSTFLEQVILRVGFFVFAMIINRLDPLAPTTHQIAMNFLLISFAFGDGLSVAAIALVGYSLGQERSDLAKIYGAFCQRIGLMCSAVVTIVYVFFGRSLFSIFSSNEQILRDGTIIMWIMCVVVLFQISQVIFSGCLRGAGDAKYITFVSFIGIGILRPLLAYVLGMALGYGIVGAWIGLAIDQGIRLVLTALRFRSGKWAEIKI